MALPFVDLSLPLLALRWLLLTFSLPWLLIRFHRLSVPFLVRSLLITV